MRQDAKTSVFTDCGVDYWGSTFTHTFEAVYVGPSGQKEGRTGLWALSNTIGATFADLNAAGQGLSFRLEDVSVRYKVQRYDDASETWKDKNNV